MLSVVGDGDRKVVCLYPQHGYVVSTTPKVALEASGEVAPGERASLRLEDGALDADLSSHRGSLEYQGVSYDLTCKTGD